MFSRALSLTNTLPIRLYRAQAYEQAGQWDAAAADCREALRLLPAASAPYFRLADIAGRRGDTNTARQFFQQGLSNDLRNADEQLLTTPDNLQALELKTTSYLRGGDYSNAIPVLTRVLALTNAYPIRLDRAQAYEQAGQLEAAAADCREAARLAPAASAPYYRLAGIYGRQGDTNAARRFFQQGLSNDLRNADEQLLTTPDSLQALELKTTSYLRGGDYSNAIPVLTQVLSLTNVYAARFYRAMAYRQTEQLDAAEADYRELLQRFPDSYQPYLGLGELALERGNTNAAREQFQRYLSRAPTNQVEYQQVAARLKALNAIPR